MGLAIPADIQPQALGTGREFVRMSGYLVNLFLLGDYASVQSNWPGLTGICFCPSLVETRNSPTNLTNL
jgi:hypothetical protein